MHGRLINAPQGKEGLPLTTVWLYSCPRGMLTIDDSLALGLPQLPQAGLPSHVDFELRVRWVIPGGSAAAGLGT